MLTAEGKPGVQQVGQTGRLLCAVGAGLLGVALVAGMIQSWRLDRRLPAIDLFGNGSKAYIKGLLAHKDYDGAIEQLQMQTRMLPLNADAYEDLGNLLLRQGRPAEAQPQFQELVRLRPAYAEGYSYLGSTYLDTQQPDLAAPCFVQAIRLRPEFPLAYNSLGVAMAQLGRLPEAEKCFAKAVELSPDYQDAQINLDRARKELRLRLKEADANKERLLSSPQATL